MAHRQPIKQAPANCAYQPPRINTGQAESRRRPDTLVVPVPMATSADRKLPCRSWRASWSDVADGVGHGGRPPRWKLPRGHDRRRRRLARGLGTTVSWADTAVEGRAWDRRGGRGRGRHLGGRGSEIGKGERRSGGERGSIRWGGSG
jgi:hypothetical protein